MTHGSLLLAAILSPVLLYAGAGAASVPILIHLFSKRRFRRIRWAAIDFLMEADRRNRRRVRIEEMILLALRCLAMVLAGSMLARFFVRPEALTAVLGSAAATERIIVLDDSFSMGLLNRGAAAGERDSPGGDPDAEERTEGIPGGRGATVFARGTAAVERIAQWLRAESPGDPVTILLASRPDDPLRTGVAAGKLDLASLKDDLAALRPSNRGGNMPEALGAVRDRLPQGPTTNAAVYVVSDFQQKDWARAEGETASGGEWERGASPASMRWQGGGSPAARLEGWANDKRSLRVVLVDVGLKACDNACVTAIEPRQPQVVAGVSARFAARITNFGKVKSKPTLLQVYVGNAARPPLSVPEIRPGQTIEVLFENTFAREGAQALTVELAPDALPIDNARAHAMPVVRAVQVLLVNGEPSTDPYEDETHLLRAALRPEGPYFSGNEVTIVEENEFERTDLATFHVVILANVFSVSEETAARLEAYVSSGGGLVVFLGDQVDAGPYNRNLYRQGEGLLPARLGEVMTMAADPPGVPFGDPDRTHPLMRRFGETAASFRDVLAWQYMTCEPAGGDVTSSAPADGTGPQDGAVVEPGSDDRGPARVLLRLGDSSASPLIVERWYGRGRVWLITTSADKEWNNLPDQPVFVVLAMEMVQHLARQPECDRNQLVGPAIEFPIDLSRHPPEVVCKPPGYPQEAETRIHAKPPEEPLGYDRPAGAPVIRYEQTERPGVYEFESAGVGNPGGDEATGEAAGDTVIQRVAVNVAPEESDLRRADRASLLASMPRLSVEYVAGDHLVVQEGAEPRRELWPALLIALVVVLMSEQALACWFGARRS